MINWNISGGIVHRKLILDYIDNNDFTKRSIEVYDGFPGLLWGGGRDLHPEKYSIKFIKEIIDLYKCRKIGFNLIMSNMFLTKNHLDNKYGNFLLEEFYGHKNGVVVFSDLLKEHIRENYPKYKIKLSITRCYMDDLMDKDNSLIVDYLKSKTKEYDRVCIPSELNLRLDIINKLKKDKLQFLINNGCMPFCKKRKGHYAQISSNTLFLQKVHSKIFQDCLALPEKRLRLSNREVSLLLKNGFYNFKLEGRGKEASFFLSQLSQYLTKY